MIWRMGGLGGSFAVCISRVRSGTWSRTFGCMVNKSRALSVSIRSSRSGTLNGGESGGLSPCDVFGTMMFGRLCGECVALVATDPPESLGSTLELNGENLSSVVNVAKDLPCIAIKAAIHPRAGPTLPLPVLAAFILGNVTFQPLFHLVDQPIELLIGSHEQLVIASAFFRAS